MIGPVPWIGGKRSLAKRIIKIFPQHRTYIEVFCGGGQVFFRKEPSTVEVINDLDGEVVNFFRVAQRHHEELLRSLRFSLVSRRWHDLYEAENPATLTDIERAVRFFFLQKTSYAGLVRRHNYSYSVTEPVKFNPSRFPQLFENIHARLERVQIECGPYEEVLERYDRPTSLFYCDPPYFGRELYRYNFTEADFEKLAERLSKLRGKFVLSLNDVPEVRRIFREFHFRSVQLPYTAQKTAGRRFDELLITNFKP